MLDGWVILTMVLLAVLVWAVARQERVYRRQAEYEARREGRRETAEQIDRVREGWWSIDIEFATRT